MDFIVVAMIIFTSVFPFTGGGPSLNVIRVIRAFRSLKSLRYTCKNAPKIF